MPNAGKWEVVGVGPILECALTRTYLVIDSRNTSHILTIRCMLQSSPDMNINTVFRIYLKPYQISRRMPLVMGLFTAEPKGGLIEVEAIPGGGMKDVDVGLCVDQDDVIKCLRAIYSGRDMTFMLLESLPSEQEPFLALPLRPLLQLTLPNDLEFKRLYNEQLDRLSTAQDATRARQFREGWYRRRSPFVR